MNTQGIGADDYYQNLGFGSLQKAATMQRDREQFNKQADAQHIQNTVSGATGGAALGYMVSGGNPIGAGVGFVAGGLLGNFL